MNFKFTQIMGMNGKLYGLDEEGQIWIWAEVSHVCPQCGVNHHREEPSESKWVRHSMKVDFNSL
jgi:hypothetical protein